MQKLKFMLVAFASLFVFNLTVAPAYAQTLEEAVKCGANNASGADCNANSNAADSLSTTIANIINVFSAIVGIIAVIMIIIAGFRFIASGGDDQAVKNARSTIMYAVIGLVVVALAQIIVQFVLKETTSSTSTSPNTPPPQASPPPPGTGRPF